MNRQASEKVLIDLQRVTKSYHAHGKKVVVLQELNMVVMKNEMVAIMGPSGSGKSTLLFLLGLFLQPTTGSYFFNGQNTLDFDRKQQAQFRRERIGFVFQGADMFEHSTVYENIEYPLIYSQSRPSERRKRIGQVLKQVNLSHRIDHSSNKLSGGEKQRVAIARAMVNNPEIILADEPTGQLDVANSQKIMEYFRTISSETETAMIIVTHDRKVAQKCDQVVHIQDGQLLSQNNCGR